MNLRDVTVNESVMVAKDRREVLRVKDDIVLGVYEDGTTERGNPEVYPSVEVSSLQVGDIFAYPRAMSPYDDCKVEKVNPVRYSRYKWGQEYKDHVIVGFAHVFLVEKAKEKKLTFADLKEGDKFRITACGKSGTTFIKYKLTPAVESMWGGAALNVVRNEIWSIANGWEVKRVP